MLISKNEISISPFELEELKSLSHKYLRCIESIQNNDGNINKDSILGILSIVLEMKSKFLETNLNQYTKVIDKCEEVLKESQEYTILRSGIVDFLYKAGNHINESLEIENFDPSYQILEKCWKCYETNSFYIPCKQAGICKNKECAEARKYLMITEKPVQKISDHLSQKSIESTTIDCLNKVYEYKSLVKNSAIAFISDDFDFTKTCSLIQTINIVNPNCLVVFVRCHAHPKNDCSGLTNRLTFTSLGINTNYFSEKIDFFLKLVS
ncbi:MAG: hypothetical protein KDD61_07100 [Bdellovibrionales bacterium]|nr:hypothetical protein [Bdellovibrionales bacterium]